VTLRVGVGIGIGVAIAVAIVSVLFDIDPDCEPDSDANPDGSLIASIFETEGAAASCLYRTRRKLQSLSWWTSPGVYPQPCAVIGPKRFFCVP